MGVIYRKEFHLKKRTKMYVRLKDPKKISINIINMF